MKVSKVTVHDETLFVRPGDEHEAVRALGGATVGASSAQIEQVEMSEAEFAAIPEYQ
ncbi:hypothetical protein [Paraburkholderia sp. SIMBA_054]|uniref:hypothetical protein n=1 Tax=Paraburkholderia sp. SIMBA_054 TaxID=3085795 RepID=UPI00397E0EA8